MADELVFVPAVDDPVDPSPPIVVPAGGLVVPIEEPVVPVEEPVVPIDEPAPVDPMPLWPAVVALGPVLLEPPMPPAAPAPPPACARAAAAGAITSAAAKVKTCIFWSIEQIPSCSACQPRRELKAQRIGMGMVNRCFPVSRQCVSRDGMSRCNDIDHDVSGFLPSRLRAFRKVLLRRLSLSGTVAWADDTIGSCHVLHGLFGIISRWHASGRRAGWSG
ncbi:MAG: hypothetical protein ACJ8AW_54020 [Rhodopila sp.]